MKFTNTFELPEYVTSWLLNDDYDYEEGVISATRLLSPARQYALYLWHKNLLEIEVSDLIASKYGTALHDSIELVNMPNIVKELRLYADIEVDGETYKISGKFDMMVDIDKPMQRLVDIKSTSVWSYIYDNKNIEYIKQLSIYRYLSYAGSKYNVSPDAEIMMIFTDWSRARAMKDPDYPQIRICIKPITLWSLTETEEYIKSRLRLFKESLASSATDLVECSPEELWQDKDKWAVMKKGKVRALKLVESEIEGRDYIISKGIKDLSLTFRPGMVKRCNYCLARKFCSQYARLKMENRIN